MAARHLAVTIITRGGRFNVIAERHAPAILDRLGFFVRAIALKFSRSQGKKVTTTNYRWSANSEPLQMFPKTSGLCFITGLRGDLAAGDSTFTLDINPGNVWTLSAHDLIEEMEVDVIGLRWDGK